MDSSFSPSVKKLFWILAATGIFCALFPWFFSYQGIVFGIKVSFRSLGNAWGWLLIIIGGTAAISKRARAFLLSIGDQLELLSPLARRRVVLFATFLYFSCVVSHKFRAQYAIGTHAFDLGFFSNICWNTANGNWFFCSIMERNFMAMHTNWILWPISWIYELTPSANVLLFCQALFLAAAIPILWVLTTQITGYFSAGLMASLLYACSPYIGHTISNDFHPDTWQVPWLLAVLWAWRHNKKVLIFVFSATALLAKEDVSVILSGFAIFLMFHRGWRLTGAFLLAFSVGALVVQTQWFIPRFTETAEKSLLFSRYHLLGGSFEEIIKNMLFNPRALWNALAYEPLKYWRLFCYLWPMAGLTILSPLYLVPPLVSVLPHILSQAGTQLDLADIYSLPSQPFLFVGAAFGAAKLMTGRLKDHKPWLAAACLVVAGIGVIKSPRYYRHQPDKRIQAFHEIKRLVPTDASVAAQQNIYPHFSERRLVHIFPIGNSFSGYQIRYLANPEFVFGDRIGNAIPYDGEQLNAAIEGMEKNASYEKLVEKENFLLFRRLSHEEPRWIEVPR